MQRSHKMYSSTHDAGFNLRPLHCRNIAYFHWPCIRKCETRSKTSRFFIFFIFICFDFLSHRVYIGNQANNIIFQWKRCELFGGAQKTGMMVKGNYTAAATTNDNIGNEDAKKKSLAISNGFVTLITLAESWGQLQCFAVHFDRKM